MRRERALKVVLVLVGLLFTAMVYPLVLFVKQEPALAMMMSLYVTLGIFLLVSVRNPSANRSLIAFTAWSSFAHAAVMSLQAFRNFIARGELIGCHSPKLDRGVFGRVPGTDNSSVRFENQGFIAEINQHRMMLAVEPTAENLEAAIPRPRRSIVEPPRQLLAENLLAMLAQSFFDLSIGVTLLHQVDRWLPYQLSQA
jgi:hypothetical protein